MVWPAYGEYRYCPRQRWVHALEVSNLLSNNLNLSNLSGEGFWLEFNPSESDLF